MNVVELSSSLELHVSFVSQGVVGARKGERHTRAA